MNTGLVNVARDVAQSKGFVPVGDDFDKGMAPYLQAAQDTITKRQENKDAKNAEVISWMEQMPDESDLPIVPDAMKDRTSAWLRSKKNEYARHASALRKLDAGSDEYQEHVANMNRINKAVVNLRENYDTFATSRLDFLDSVHANDISNGTNPEDHDFLSRAYTDRFEGLIDEDGEVFVETFEKSHKMKEMPKFHRVDKTVSKALFDEFKRVSQNGLPLDPASQAFVKQQLKSIIRQGGREALVSLASDGIFTELISGGTSMLPGFGLSDDLVHDPERQGELEETVVNILHSMLVQNAQGVYNQQTQADDAERNKKTAAAVEIAKAKKTYKPPTYSLDKEFLLDD